MFSFDLERETLKNKDYRRVIHTTPYQQLVLMKLSPETGANVPWEIHEYATQFIRVEKGGLKVQVESPKGFVETQIITDGQSVIIAPGVRHYISALEGKTVKLYTIYSPPEHKDGLVQDKKQ
jgi:quercetin dioxygenase-like cupin family protein